MIHATRVLRACALALATAAALSGAGQAAEDASPLSGVVNINTATSEQLELLPGIGAARAQAVIALRKQRGGFKSVDELQDVRGIGEAGLARLRPYVRLEGKTTAQRP